MELLDKYFETAFAAPDGIKRLRELILTLAMQGKLVPQNPQDSPASELLKEIEAEKKQLRKEKKIRKSKPLPEITFEEIPYQIPQNWEWCYLNDICTVVTDGTHHTPTYTEKGIPFLSVKDLSSGKINFSDTRFISLQEHQELIKRCHPEFGDVLLTKVGTTGIAVSINTKDDFSIFVSVALLKLVTGTVDTNFITRLINSPLVKKYSSEGTEGVGNKNLVLRKIKAFIVPLPPLKEQHRIVEKIDRLMEKVDRLEKLKKERDRKQLIIHAAASDRLLNAPDKNSFNDAWNFIQNNFNQLYSVKENISELRKTILQLAVMGKLVPQNPNDPPASELLKEIEAEKKRLIKEGKIKKQKSLPRIQPEEIPYELPKNWKWIRLGDSGSFERGKSKHRPRNDKRLFENGTYPFIQTGDVSKAKKNKDRITTCTGYYNDFGLAQSRLWEKDTLCITIAANIAETGFLDFEACVPDSVVTFKSLDDMISKFVKIFIDIAKEHLENYAPATAQKNINLGIINKLVFPLPPLPEQHRIIAKVDRLMALCDRLEAELTKRTEKQTALLNEVIAAI